MLDLFALSLVGRSSLRVVLFVEGMEWSYNLNVQNIETLKCKLLWSQNGDLDMAKIAINKELLFFMLVLIGQDNDLYKSENREKSKNSILQQPTQNTHILSVFWFSLFE